MVHANVNPIIVAGGLMVDGINIARCYAKNFAAAWRPNIYTVVTGQTKLGIVFGIGPKVLGDNSVLCWPDLESEIAHRVSYIVSILLIDYVM